MEKTEYSLELTSKACSYEIKQLRHENDLLLRRVQELLNESIETKQELVEVRKHRDVNLKDLQTECDDLGEEIRDYRACIVWHEKFLIERGLLAEFDQWVATARR